MRVIQYELARPADVTIRIFDASGRLVETADRGAQAAGSHEFRWKGAASGPGVYFVRVMIDGQESSSKVVRIQ